MSLEELEQVEQVEGAEKSLCDVYGGKNDLSVSPSCDTLAVHSTKEEQGPVDRKAAINKIKEIDARLSCMLSASYETSKKLRMLSEDFSLSDNSDDLSDLSLLFDRQC
jgi:hypothetical protein